MDLKHGFRLGEWKVLPLQGEIFSADLSRRVQPKAMDVLLQLCASAPHVVSRQELIDAVWSHRAVTDEPLTRCIGELRRAFDDGSGERQYVETIPKRGYRLLYSPEPSEDPEAGTDEPGRPGIPFRSLAVMPFRFLGGEDDISYLGEGLAEELITALTAYANVSVAARTSAFSLRDACHKDVREKLGVRYILEGSFAREGDRVRLNVQLVNAETGYQRFAKTIEVEGEGLFAMQDQLRTEVLRSLPASFGTDDQVDHVKRHRLGGHAHDAYLRGMRALHVRDLVTAASMFEAATSAEPGFSLAHAAYAITLILQTRYYLSDDWDKSLETAERHARLALESDPESGKAHGAMGLVHISRYAWQDAEETFQAILETHPRDAELRQWCGELYILMNDMPAATHQLELASQFDPLSPLPLRTLGYISHCLGNAGAAEQYLRSACAAASESGQYILSIFLSTFLLSQQRLDEAAEYLRRLIWMEPVADDDIRRVIGAIRDYHESKRRQSLPESLTGAAIPPTILGRLLAASGNFERAVEVFESSFDRRDFWAMSVLSDPLLAELREQPVARTLVDRMHGSLAGTDLV